MALHGLGSMTLGVPRVDDAREFYREFGLTESTPGVFATRDGGEQLHVVERPVRQLVEVTLAADDPDDLGTHRGRRHRPRSRRHHRRRPAASRCSSRWSASASASPCAIGSRKTAYDIATDERSGQHGARRRSGAGDLRRGHGGAAPARSRAVGHARHRRQQALPRRRARLPVERRVGRHHRLPALLAPIITTSG